MTLWVNDWPRLLIDIAIPVAAILVPTIIAVRLASRERAAAIEDRKHTRAAALEDRADARAEAARERRLHASEGVIVGLAHLISLDVSNRPIQELLGELRGRIAVYRAWIEPGDLSGDWLALKHSEGMRVWHAAMENLEEIGGSGPDNQDEVFEILDSPRRWAQGTIETFSGWLSGQVETEVLRAEGATLIAAGERPSD